MLHFICEISLVVEINSVVHFITGTTSSVSIAFGQVVILRFFALQWRLIQRIAVKFGIAKGLLILDPYIADIYQHTKFGAY